MFSWLFDKRFYSVNEFLNDIDKSKHVCNELFIDLLLISNIEFQFHFPLFVFLVIYDEMNVIK